MQLVWQSIEDVKSVWRKHVHKNMYDQCTVTGPLWDSAVRCETRDWIEIITITKLFCLTSCLGHLLHRLSCHRWHHKWREYPMQCHATYADHWTHLESTTELSDSDMPPLSYNEFEWLALVAITFISAMNGNDTSHYQSTVKTYEITNLTKKMKFNLKCSECFGIQC